MSGNVFVIGGTKTGKTTLARHLAQMFAMMVVSGSAWVVQRCPRKEFSSPQERTEVLTAFSKEALRENPDACIQHIRSQHDLGRGGLIIEGLRNPRDFSNLFDPRRDLVVILDRSATVISSQFEVAGLESIRSMVRWMRGTGMVEESRARFFSIEDLDDQRETVAVVVMEWFTQQFMQRQAALPTTSSFVHAPIPALKALIAEELLYDMDPAYVGKLRECTVFGVSSYIGHSPTFQVLLDDGSVFSYIPPSELLHQSGESLVGKFLALEDLVYTGCKTSEIAVTRYPVLAEQPVQAWFRGPKRWLSGQYHCTIDWYTGNQLSHLILLENGQIALLPSHKLRFGRGQTPLPAYRKLHAEFKME